MSGADRVEFRRSSVGIVFQFFNLIPTLTALENVALVAELTMSDGLGRSREVLDLVGLGERMDHFPAQLSGGEQQRVAIARALVKQPPILLCDEPTGELDFETGRMIIALLRRLNRDNGQTVLIVTHNAGIGEAADRVVRLRSGAVVDDVVNPSPLDPEELTW
jgi:putative ABC transport system ATP-binding protein